MKCEIQSYHSNIEVDANPVHTLSMLMVLLRKEKYDINEFSAFLTSSSSEGWTFPAVLRLRMDIVDLKDDSA